MKNMGTADTKGFDPGEANDADSEDSDDEELPDLE